MKKEKNIAIIPARGGSKRIPRKNIKNFLGKPIIAYSIETALQSGLFDEVMVSTDDSEIEKISCKYGASVPFLRSKKNADDFAVLTDVIEEVLTRYQSNGQFFDNFCCILPTAPLLTSEYLYRSYKKLTENNFDSVFPVVPYTFPIQRALKFSGEKIQMIQAEFKNHRSQDLEPAYHDAGMFYWMKTKPFLEKKTLWTDETGAIVISNIYAQDIDTMEDWKIAELKYKLLNEQRKKDI